MTWQPITSAPKDGTWVLLRGGKIDYGWDRDAKPSAVIGQYYGLNEYGQEAWQFAWYDSGYYGEYENPTEWMHIPE